MPILSLGPYDSPLGSVVRSLKYESRIDLVEPLADHLAALAMSRLGVTRGCLCVPVPAHARRLTARGFNQASLLASAVARRLNGDFSPRLLKRVRYTLPQPGLDRSDRQRNLAGAIELHKSLEHGRVLLIDDVLSTGATASECLKSLGPRVDLHLAVLVVARASRGPPA